MDLHCTTHTHETQLKFRCSRRTHMKLKAKSNCRPNKNLHLIFCDCFRACADVAPLPSGLNCALLSLGVPFGSLAFEIGDFIFDLCRHILHTAKEWVQQVANARCVTKVQNVADLTQLQNIPESQNSSVCSSLSPIT